MMCKHFVLLLAACSLLAQVATIGDIPPPPPGEGPAPESAPPAPPAGKSLISGTVVNAKTKEPVRKSRVTLNGPTMLNAVTDSSGGFTFRALPPGTYMVTAVHDDFYDNPSGVDMVPQFAVGEEEEMRGIVVTLMPGAAISGRVFDEDDLPVSNCFITALVLERNQQGRARFRNHSGGNTDDQGLYRLHGLRQGRYILKAQCNGSFPAPHGFMRRHDPMTPREGYAPVFYAAGDPNSSAGLPIAAGADLSGIDFHVRRVPVYSLRGTIVGMDETRLRGAQITLTSRGSPGDDPGYHANYDGARNQVLFHNVPAGSYELSAFAFNNERAYEGRQNVEVGKTQVTEFELRMSAAAILTGSVASDDPNQRFDNMPVTLQPLSDRYRGPYPMATIKDGSFEFKAVLPGHFHLNPLPTGYIKTLTVGGREVSPSDFEITGESAGQVQISIGSKMARITVEPTPRPKAGEQVFAILIPESGLDPANGRNMAMAGAGGEIEFSAVAPGKYHALVVAGSNIWGLMNQPDVLKALESRSVPVEAVEGDDKKISASVVSTEDLRKASGSAE